MELRSSLTLCSATSRRPFSMPAKSKRLLTKPEGMARINLLLIEKAGKFHYTWIKDLNRLLYDQSKHRERKHFFMGTKERTCWRPTDQRTEGLGRPQSGWRCRRRRKTSSPSRTTINNSQPPSSSVPTEALTSKIRAPSWTQ